MYFIITFPTMLKTCIGLYKFEHADIYKRDIIKSSTQLCFRFENSFSSLQGMNTVTVSYISFQVVKMAFCGVRPSFKFYEYL